MYLSSREVQRLNPTLARNAEAVSECLTQAGFEVLGVDSLRSFLTPIVVGLVEHVEPHPDADRLRICTVSDGSDQRLQIVTGAENVREGGYFPLIRSGTRLPDGRKIKRGKLRGVVSEGMLGSASELELGEQQDGLMELEGAPSPGTPLAEIVEAEGFVIRLAGKPEPADVLEALRED